MTERWEYLFVHIAAGRVLLNGKPSNYSATEPNYYELFNDLGNSGWEMVVVMSDGSGLQESYWFKRPKEPKRNPN
jgi:hypothetical protein